jgi:4-amino-4-deoxy-L-arabinose transferase-like glycosyltransferase
VAITAGAGALRLISLGAVPQDPFYDAAVRSMSLSWHNFFFGAFDPSGATAIDKPPLDLWLQVASVQILGFGRAALKLPQALAGTAAVPLLFVALRRVFGTGTALISALALAVLPIAVLTARSDTTDAVMMALMVAALGLVVRSTLTGRYLWLYLAAAALGLAFNIKLLEALIPVAPLAVLAWLGLPGSRARRVLHLGGAGLVLVAVSLSWLLATLAFPASQRPFAIGSTNGSAWNAAFVFNGYDRIFKSARSDSVTASQSPGPGADVVSGTGRGHDAALDRLPIRPPSATRLLSRAGPLSGRRLGFVLVAALLLGVPALVVAARARPRAPPTPRASAPVASIERARRATAVSLLLWLVGGVVLFSAMTRLHARYVEAFDPVVAGAAGLGLAWGLRSGRGPRLVLLGTVAGLAGYAWYLKGGSSAVGWVTAGAALAAAAGILATMLPGRRPGPPAARSRLAGVVLVAALAALLALPATVSVAIVEDHVSDAGLAGYMPAGQLAALSSFLRTHRHGARYEVAVASATQAGSLIVHDGLPVLILTAYDGRVLTSRARLQQLAAHGAVRYALLGSNCRPGDRLTLASCSAPVLWVRAHGRDVSKAAGLSHRAVLWRLPTR